MTGRLTMVRIPVALLLASGSMMIQVPSPAYSAASSASIEIANFTFNAPIVTVRPGTIVTWTNGDDIPHTIVSSDGLFRSKVLDTGERFSFTFAKPGQFGYFCSIHPHMTGRIIVKA